MDYRIKYGLDNEQLESYIRTKLYLGFNKKVEELKRQQKGFTALYSIKEQHYWHNFTDK